MVWKHWQDAVQRERGPGGYFSRLDSRCRQAKTEEAMVSEWPGAAESFGIWMTF